MKELQLFLNNLKAKIRLDDCARLPITFEDLKSLTERTILELEEPEDALFYITVKQTKGVYTAHFNYNGHIIAASGNTITSLLVNLIRNFQPVASSS